VKRCNQIGNVLQDLGGGQRWRGQERHLSACLASAVRKIVVQADPRDSWVSIARKSCGVRGETSSGGLLDRDSTGNGLAPDAKPTSNVAIETWTLQNEGGSGLMGPEAIVHYLES